MAWERSSPRNTCRLASHHGGVLLLLLLSCSLLTTRRNKRTKNEWYERTCQFLGVEFMLTAATALMMMDVFSSNCGGSFKHSTKGHIGRQERISIHHDAHEISVVFHHGNHGIIIIAIMVVVVGVDSVVGGVRGCSSCGHCRVWGWMDACVMCVCEEWGEGESVKWEMELCSFLLFGGLFLGSTVLCVDWCLFVLLFDGWWIEKRRCDGWWWAAGRNENLPYYNRETGRSKTLVQ